MYRDNRRITLLLTGLLIVFIHINTLAQDDTDTICESFADATPSTFIGAGNAYFESGDFTRAIEVYTCAIDLEPDYAPTYVSRGYAYASQRNDDLALADYEQALSIDANLVSAYNNRGLLYTTRGSFAQALADFDLAIALDPEYALAYYNRGIVHAAESSYELALADLNRVLEIDPTFAEAHAAIGAVHVALALESYDNFQSTAGELAVPPGGSANIVLRALQEARAADSFTPWLPLQTPAQ